MKDIYNYINHSTSLVTIVFLLSISLVSPVYSLCETGQGEKVAILEIPESLGQRMDQETKPRELPITGNLSEIELTVLSETHRYFTLKDKRLVLNRPLDRDKDGLTSIYMQISCLEKRSGVKKSIPILVKVMDINDNPPIFKSNHYAVNVSELTPIGSTIFKDLEATDSDSGNNGLVEYLIQPLDGGQTDGFGYFEIKMPHQGLVTIKKPLDYERTNLYKLKVIAMDKGYNGSDRLSSTAILTINVIDGDDQDPYFVNKNCQLNKEGRCSEVNYFASVTSDSTIGIVNISPEAIFARDGDTLNTSVVYSFVNGTPSNYVDYFSIDRTSGLVKQLKRVDRSLIKSFTINVKAEQLDNPKRHSFAKLTIQIVAVDKNPPMIKASSFDGYVPEGSAIGTIVYQDRLTKTPLKLTVTDPDIGKDDAPAIYEFEVTSNSFRVNGDGYLIVDDPNLDRDPPNPSIYKFQVIARQLGAPKGKGASPPITINVHLEDVNDNQPKLPTLSPVTIQAGEGARNVYRIEAKDLDEVDSGRLRYAIFHVSNLGRERFRIDSSTGQIEAIGKLVAGEQYSLTISVTDSSGKSNQGILEVVVVRGPNTGGPAFPKERYEIEISEGISVGSTVITLKAVDPENDPVKYSIVEGNVNKDFTIDSVTGVVYVGQPLDREEVSSYNLIVKAEDRDGLFSTVSLIISVTDINDENPHFLRSNYTFKVDEGTADAFVGKVTARDADIGENAEVVYSLSDDHHFRINPTSGDIFTAMALDYERVKEHFFVVTAKDKAPNARLSTASVTVQVLDLQDELPTFTQPVYTVSVPENYANRHLVQVKAIDPDSLPSITYVIRDGDKSLFSVDPSTGIVKVIRSLDYETRNSYTLIIGTVENDSDDPRATTQVYVSVVDMNDNPPDFVSLPSPIRLQDSVPLGTILTTIRANDADGTAPGNIVRYEIIGRDKAPAFFIIDSTTGIISVKDDLRKDPESEYRIDIIARDNGSPSLSASATLTVFVDHIATPSPDPGLGFADSKYTVEIDENTPSSTIVKTLPIMNKPRSHFTFTCEIISGNDEDKFSIVENSNQDCEIRIKEPLDYEHQSRYMLTLRLNSIAGLAGFSRLMTQIVINVMDVNDNKPVFHVPGRYSHLTRDRYIAAISSDAPADSQVAQLKATDSDSIANGIITYSLIPSSDPQGRFKIEPGSGILRTSRPMEDIPPSQLPLRLEVIVRDNPQLQSSSLSESSEVIVNLIEDKHRLIFVLRDTSTGRAQESKEQFLQIIQDRTGLITGWEKAESLKIQRNHTIESDVTGTDIWIHLIDPSTLKILPTDDPKIESILSDVKIKYSLIQALTSGLGLASSTLTVRSPYVPIIVSTAAVVPIPMNSDINNLGLGLIVLAAAIAVCGCAGIVYQCGSSSKSSSAPTTGSTISKPGGGKVKRVMMSPAPPRLYDPIYTAETVTSSSILANNGKQYETQVLHMDMKIDDEMGGRGIERGGYNGHHLSSSTHSSSSSSSTPLESDKTSLRGLISVRDLMSNVSYMPRSRAYNNHSPSTVTSTVNDKSSSSRSTSRPESSGSSSSNEGLKSNLKTPLYYKLLDDNRSPMFTDGRTLLTRDGKTTEL